MKNNDKKPNIPQNEDELSDIELEEVVGGSTQSYIIRCGPYDCHSDGTHASASRQGHPEIWGRSAGRPGLIKPS